MEVPPPHTPTASTPLPLPPLGRVHSALLADGDPVWIVRTQQDEVRVFGASVRLERDGHQRSVLTAFDPACACFRAAAPVIWNLEGEVSARTEPDYSAICSGCAIGVHRHFDGDSSFWMDRFDFERRGESVVVGPRWAATEIGPVDGRALPVVSEVASQELECPEEPIQTSIESALSRPVGQRVRFAGRVLMYEGIARLCSSDDMVDDHCPDDAPPVYSPSEEVLQKGAWAPSEAGALLIPGALTWHRRLSARRAGDGFAEVSSQQCDPVRTSATDSDTGPGLPAICDSPIHDESWVRTPFNAETGIWVEAPLGCEERERPSMRMLRVRGRGSRHAGNEDEIPERCHHPSSADDCASVPWSTIHASIFTAIREHNYAHPTFNAHFTYGIGGCFDAHPDTEGRLALMITDWRYADEAIRLVSEALERWKVDETFWVSVEPALCMHPGAFGSLSGSLNAVD